MKKTSRMMMAEAIQEVFRGELTTTQRASIKSSVKLIGDSLLIDILCGEILQLAEDTDVLMSNIISKITKRLISEVLFKMIERTVTDKKDIQYLINLLTKKNAFMIKGLPGENINRKIELTRLFMAIDSQRINAKSALKVLLAKRRKAALVSRAKKIGMQCRPVLDMIVRKFISYSDKLEIVTVQRSCRPPVYRISSSRPSSFLTSYMHTTPQSSLCNKLSMNIDGNTVAREAVERITGMPFTMDEQFNKTVIEILDTNLFVDLMRGKSADEVSTAAKVAQIRHSTKEGLRFWEEAGKGIVYFTYVLDFRGRISQVGGISAVGNKVGKSMLRSGVKYPLGDHGHDQLLIGLASAMGKDKETFDVRLKWGKENEHKYANIGRVLCTNAKAGYVQLLKNGADDAFTASAISIELHRISMHHGAIRDYESNLFIGYDATSSAVQLVGLIMGNETLTEASNVRVGEDTEDKIHDAYMLMSNSMDKAVEKLKGTINREGADEVLEQWLNFSTKQKRAIAKPLLMTRLYGSKLRTHIKRSKEAAIELGILDADKDAPLTLFGITIARLFNYAFDNEQGYNALRGYEDFVKKIAAAYVSKGMNSKWTVQSNSDMDFHSVTSLYYKFEGSRYYVYADGKKFPSRTYNLDILGDCEESMQFEEHVELDKSKAKSSIAPNYIHSHDALVLYETVLRMDCPMRLTHDCFAAPAGLAHDMQKATTTVYADLFGDNNLHQLEKLQEECFVNTGIKVELPVEYNKNGIPTTQIKKAIYAFS